MIKIGIKHKNNDQDATKVLRRMRSITCEYSLRSLVRFNVVAILTTLTLGHILCDTFGCTFCDCYTFD